MSTVRMPPVRTWRWTRARYDEAIKLGVIDEDDPIELLDGLLVVREPQGSRHVKAVFKVRRALERVFGRGYQVHDHVPVALDERSEPEPDVAVVRGGLAAYSDALPSNPVLVVEVADSSLAKDRLRKSAIYARAGVTDYWIVNLVEDVLEVHREPVRAAPTTWKYRSLRLLKRNAVVTPLAVPRARVRVADLLP